MAKCGSIDWSMREKTMSSHPVIDAWKRAFKEKELEKEYEEFQKRLAREKEEQARAAKRLQFHQHLQQMVSDELQRQAWKRRSTHAKLAGPTFAFRAPAESFVQHSPWTKRLVSHMDAYFPPLQSIDSQYAAIPTLADSASSLSVLRPEAAVRAAEKVVEMASDSSEDGSSDEDGPSPEAKPPPPEASRSAAPQPAQAAEASQAVRRSAEGKEEGLVARGIQAANARPSTSPVYSAAASSGAATAPRGSERPATAVAGLAHHPCDSWPGRANDRQRAALAHPPAPRFRRGGAARPQTDSGARQRANVDGAAPAAVVTSPAAEGRLASPPLLRSRSPARLGPLRSACGPSLGGGGSRSAPALGSSGGVGGCGGGCSGGGAARVGTGTARRFKPVREEAREEEGRVPPCLALGAAGSGDEKEEAWRGGAHPPPSLRTRPMASLFANEAAALDADARTRRALRAASCFAELGYEELHKIAAAGAGRWLPRYAVLFREGAAANAFYVLVRGRVAQSWLEIDTEAPRAQFELGVEEKAGGETAGVCLGLEALTNLPRTCTLTALEDCLLLQFPLEATAYLRDEGAATLASRIFQTFVEREIRALQMLRNLPADKLQAVVPMFELLELPVAGMAVFIEGDPGDAFYILVSGSVAVQQGGVELAQLHSEGKGRSAREDGCFFGEMSLIDAKPRIATVRTLGPTKLLVLRAPMFHAFLDRVPDFKRKVVEQQGRRNIDNQYQSRNRSAGACGLELEFGACAGMMRGASPTQGAVFADTYQRKHADEITLRRTRELLRAPTCPNMAVRRRGKG